MRKSKRAVYNNGELSLIQRGNVYHIYGTRQGRRIRVSAETDNLLVAQRRLDDMCIELDSGWRASELTSQLPWEEVARQAWVRHKMSSKTRGIPFEISPTVVYRAMEETGFRCAVSGIAFSRKMGRGPVDPWSPSIDRIDNRHGYLPDNIRVVCVAANYAMNQWGQDVLLRLAKAVVRNASRVTPEIETDTKFAQSVSNKEPSS
jgi:hypothetical protein